MPGLTINTDAQASQTAHNTSEAAAAAAANTVANNQQPASSSQPSASESRSRSSSPARLPYSPITPPLNPINLPSNPPAASFLQDRPSFSHPSQTTQTGISAPRPEPIEFDSNPDVLALKSAISILQMQRLKATEDIRALDAAKRAALEHPEEFTKDLMEGRVGVEADKLFVDRPAGQGDDDSSSEDEDSNVGDERDVKMKQSPSTSERISNGAAPVSAAWRTLPKPQNIVRCPPINWSQYAVVGESLDKIHNEQLSRPNLGVPAVMKPDGTFEFRGDGSGEQRKLSGIAAPYTPGKDKIDKKPKGGKR